MGREGAGACTIRSQASQLSFGRLVHLRVALAARVLGRRRRMDDGRIDNRAGRDLDPLGLQMEVHRIQHHAAQIMLFEQVPEPADSHLIRRRRSPKVHPNEPLQHRRFIQSFLHARVRQVEPLLHEIRPQHDLQPHRTPPVTSLRIVRLHQQAQRRPGNDPLHLVQKQLPPALPTILLKHRLRPKCALTHRSHLTR